MHAPTIMMMHLAITNKFMTSASDNGWYPEIALEAALCQKRYAKFRRNRNYMRILEHVDVRLASDYLDIIQDKYGLSEDIIMDLVGPLQQEGGPILRKLKKLSSPISTTALRYLKVALDIKERYGAEMGRVVEIGCGFGGQAILLDKITRIKSYTFIDLWQVNMLIRRFIENSSLSCDYAVATIRDLKLREDKWDIIISNYAFSELKRECQQQYVEKVLLNARHGYMTMNSGFGGKFGGIHNMRVDELTQLIRNCRIIEETPKTGFNNFVLTW